MENSRHKRIEQIVRNAPSGSVFAISDFSDIAVPETASKVLIRLCKAGVLEKTMRGVFHKPEEGKPAYPDGIARAIARSNGWKAVPEGKTALYLFGIIQEKPDVWTYVTDGTYREYHYSGTTIKFRRISKKLLAMSEKSAGLVQILKNFRKNSISDEIKEKLRSFVGAGDCVNVIRETRNTTVWISKTVSVIFGKKSARKNAV